MKTFLRIGVTGLVITGIVAVGAWILTDPNIGKSSSASRTGAGNGHSPTGGASVSHNRSGPAGAALQ